MILSVWKNHILIWRRHWNMARWGSEAGPAIVIDWDSHKIMCLRMSRRLSTRIALWVLRGERER